MLKFFKRKQSAQEINTEKILKAISAMKTTQLEMSRRINEIKNSVRIDEIQSKERLSDIEASIRSLHSDLIEKTPRTYESALMHRILWVEYTIINALKEIYPDKLYGFNPKEPSEQQ